MNKSGLALTGRGEAREFADGIHDAGLLLLGQVVEEGEPHEAVADVLGDRAVARQCPEASAHLREVEREVVEDGEDASRLEIRDQALARLPRREDQVEEVKGLLPVAG